MKEIRKHSEQHLPEQEENPLIPVSNLGLWYYRSFFKEYFEAESKYTSEPKEFSGWLKKEYDKILKTEYSEYNDISELDANNSYNKNPQEFSLKTIYPGLVCGIGYEHETGLTNEFKLGFLFDHTTGLPYIPGSSVKGVIRSAFNHPDYLSSVLGELISNPSDWLKDLKKDVEEKQWNLMRIQNEADWARLENHIFEGVDYLTNNSVDTYKSDIFYDAQLSGVQEHKGKSFFMADDFITCHQNRKKPAMTPFTNPIPVRFLKVRSGVTFTFRFRLADIKISDGLIFTASLKKELFRKILLDFGIGAKTNVGYGQFEEVPEEA